MERRSGRPKGRCELILAGAGGQGLILSAILLGEAAIREGKNVVQTQSYGIAARGGPSVAELIIDREEIIFQQVRKPDVVLALTGTAVNQFGPFAERGSLLFCDTTSASAPKGSNCFGFPFTRLASGLGPAGTANLVALGAMVAYTNIVRMESLVSVVHETFPRDTAAVNIEALHLGQGLIAAPRGEGHGREG